MSRSLQKRETIEELIARLKERPPQRVSLHGRFLTTQQVSEITGLAVASLSNMRHQGRGPRFVRLDGGSIRYLYDDIYDHFMSRSVIPGKGKDE